MTPNEPTGTQNRTLPCTCTDGFTCQSCLSKPRKAKQAQPTEQQIQRQCVAWFRKAYPDTVIASIRNEAKYGSKQKHYGALANMAGRHAGIADLIILAVRPPYGALFVELKTVKGRPTPDQIEFMGYCAKSGYLYAIVRNIDEFKQIVNGYLL